MTTTANASTFDLMLTTADGLEGALMTELHHLFGKMVGRIVRTGRVALTTDLKGLYQLCLYSRVASRILLPLKDYHFKKSIDSTGKTVIDEDIAQALYQAAKQVTWTSLFSPDNTFVVRVSVDKRVAVNQQFATLRIKDAIADKFNEKFGERPSVDSKAPHFIIHAHIGHEMAELSLDLSGGSLHRRGYRIANTDAPLKENLAAALLYECGWHLGKFDTLIDPMCGSGTFVIEALLMSVDYPVGIEGQFGFSYWRSHKETLWQACKKEAMDTFLEKLDKPLPSVFAFDGDTYAIEAAHQNLYASALKASPFLNQCLNLRQQTLDRLKETLIPLNLQSVLVISNPPYGERLGDEALIKPLYQGLGLMLNEALSHAYVGVLAAKVEEADTLPIVVPKTLKCHNGALTVYFRHGYLNHSYSPSLIERYEKKELTVNIDDDVFAAQALEFANRLQKNLGQLKKEAKKQHITNLRIYDADLPNFNLVIDLYGNYVHIQEYQAPKHIDEATARHRFNLSLSIVRQVLDINREQIFIKTRKKQSGNDQYTKESNKGKMHIVKEDQAYFYVNFSDYLDTGLFIDHRSMRKLIKTHSKQKSVLNLFAYTCSASVHAALAQARHVVSVDLSQNYLNWGKRNFALNGLILDEHYEFIAADVFEWIKTHGQKYDIIFIDPPTFSNSKKFKGTFDVQRDHAALINRAMNRLNSDGVLYFSNNFSKFVLDESLKSRYDISQITQKTTGFDFKKSIHQSFEIRHKTHQIIEQQNTALSNNSEGVLLRNHKTNTKMIHSNFKTNDKHSKEKNPKKPSNKTQNPKYSPQPSTPSKKRVFVNPKLANRDELEKRLTALIKTENEQIGE